MKIINTVSENTSTQKINNLLEITNDNISDAIGIAFSYLYDLFMIEKKVDK